MRPIDPIAVIISGVLFFLAGLAFGYSLGPPLMWIPVVFPVVMFIAAALKDGPTVSMLIRLVVFLAVTFLGIFLGQRLAPEAKPEEAPG